MRTSIVVKRWHQDMLSRSPLPSEAEQMPGIERQGAFPVYTPPKKTTFKQKGKMPEFHEASLTAHNNTFDFINDRVDRIRIMPPQYVEAINDLDGERARLQAKLDDIDKRERSLLGAAYDLGTPIERAKAIELFSRKATEPAAT